jgi:hypothetical protein
MNVLTWFRVVVSSCLGLLLLLTLQAKHGECINQEKQNFQIKSLKTENDIIRDATKIIKKSLKESGHPSSIRCTYAFSGNNTISTTTKIYYDEYRKKPDFLKECYLHESVPADKVVEIFYKKHDDSLSLVLKNPKHKHEKISSKDIKLPTSLRA